MSDGLPPLCPDAAGYREAIDRLTEESENKNLSIRNLQAWMPHIEDGGGAVAKSTTHTTTSIAANIEVSTSSPIHRTPSSSTSTSHTANTHTEGLFQKEITHLKQEIGRPKTPTLN